MIDILGFIVFFFLFLDLLAYSLNSEFKYKGNSVADGTLTRTFLMFVKIKKEN